MSSRLLFRVAVACLLALPLLAAPLPRPFGARGAGVSGGGAGINPASCSENDCCWREGKTERFCTCSRFFRQQRGGGICAAVDCVRGPPPGACDAPPRRRGMGSGVGGGVSGGDVGGGGGGQRCACAEVYFPVCADGKDYSNQCEVRRALHAGGASRRSCSGSRLGGRGRTPSARARNDAVKC
jgi:hypothetical protein